MQDAEEADFASQMASIARDLEQGVDAGMDQQVEDDLLVQLSYRSEFARPSEDSMHRVYGQVQISARLGEFFRFLNRWQCCP